MNTEWSRARHRACPLCFTVERVLRTCGCRGLVLRSAAMPIRTRTGRVIRAISGLGVRAALCAAVAAGGVGAASADEFVDRANEPYKAIRAELRSDTILLPLLAKVEAPPKFLEAAGRARLLPAGSSQWSEAEAWALGESQQALLKAIHQVTQEEDYRVAFGFGQNYGTQGVPVAQIRDKMYTELGDPPLLAAKKFLWGEALQRASVLVQVEATRLAAAGKPADAIDLLVDWTFVGRQLADREFAHEMRFGLGIMLVSLERIRDIAYEDSRGSAQLSADRLKAVIDRLDEKKFIGLSRLTLPGADLIAAEQVIARVYVERNGVNKATFGQTLARLKSSNRPLRLLGEAAKWDAIADRQQNWFDIKETLSRVGNDWTSRWTLEWFDPRMSQAFEYGKLGSNASAVREVVADLGELFDLRQVVWAEAVGTRHALALYCAKLDGGQWPPTLASVRPIWIAQLEADPFNPRRERGAKPPLEYFVPIRDTKSQFGEREDPRPHEMSIVTPESNFSRRIGEDQCVLYSVGGNGGKDWARRIQNSSSNVANADYLIWPPVLSLQRQHLVESGQLK